MGCPRAVRGHWVGSCGSHLAFCLLYLYFVFVFFVFCICDPGQWVTPCFLSFPESAAMLTITMSTTTRPTSANSTTKSHKYELARMKDELNAMLSEKKYILSFLTLMSDWSFKGCLCVYALNVSLT